MATVASWVSKRPNRCGGDACVRDTRITVWGLVAQRRLNATDAEILQATSGPGFQPGYAAGGRGQRRQHQDRHVLLGPQRPGEIEAGLARHHDVEHQKVEVQAGELASGLAGIAGDGDAKTILG